jgi:hypothetical protein
MAALSTRSLALTVDATDPNFFSVVEAGSDEKEDSLASGPPVHSAPRAGKRFDQNQLADRDAWSPYHVGHIIDDARGPEGLK